MPTHVPYLYVRLQGLGDQQIEFLTTNERDIDYALAMGWSLEHSEKIWLH